MQNSSLSPDPSDNISDFLIAQLELTYNSRVHTEALIDREAQYFFTLLGAAAAAGGIILQIGASTLVMIGAIHLFTLVLFVAGYRLLRRIPVLSGMLGLYAAQASLIRRYFVDRDSSIRRYLILQIASTEEPPHSFIPPSRQTSMRLLPYLNSILLAMAVFLVSVEIYLLQMPVYTSSRWDILFAVLGVTAIIVAALFFRHQKRLIRSLGDRFLDNVNDVVHERLQI